MLRFFGKIFFILLIAGLLSIGVDYFYRQVYGLTYHFPENILIPQTQDSTKKYDLVKLGNSHAEDGLIFDQINVKSLDLASVAQSFEYDLAMLKMYTNLIKKDAVILINVSPLSLSQKTPGKDEYANMNYYDGRLSPFLIPHLKVSEYIQIQLVPFVRAGYVWREKHAFEVKEKITTIYAETWSKPPPEVAPTVIPKPTPIETSITTPSATHKMTVTEMIKALNKPPDPTSTKFEESAEFIVRKWYHSGDFGTQYFANNRKDLEALVAYCLKRNWKPVLITLPISQPLLDALGPGYLKRYVYDHLESEQLKQLTYIDFASNKVLTKNTDLFNNSDHLNQKGAEITSYLLLQELIKAKYLPESANGYDEK